MALTYTTDFVGIPFPQSDTITTGTLTVSPGDFITLAVSYADNAQTTAWTVSNTGDAITWTKQIETNVASNDKIIMWSGTAGATPPTTISVQSTAGSKILGSKVLFTAVHTGADSKNPLPSGNLFSGTGGTTVSQAVTPTSNGSALWMFPTDWASLGVLAAAANCDLAGTLYNDFSQTAVPIRPTVQPRPDTTSFTIGETDTAGSKIAWGVWEVQAAPESIITQRRLNIRDLKSGFRSNVLRRGKIAWREAVYRDLNPQATNPPAFTTHATTGVLTGQGSSIVGSAAHVATHTTTGVLAGLVAVIAGAATRFGAHATTGVLTGQGSTIVGSAAHKAKHTTTGVLTGQGSTIVGAARRFITHVASGVLTGQGSTIVGAAKRFITHVTSGVLTGQGSVIVGAASRTSVSNTHVTSGALVGQSSSIVGSAAHKAKHTTTGVLTGQSAIIAGSAAHKLKHVTTGALIGQLSVVVGSSVHKVKHVTTGALIGFGAIITGVAVNGTTVITKRFGVSYWKPVEKEEPILEETVEEWTEPDLFEKLKETRTMHEAIIKKAQQAELMEEQQKIRLRKAQDDQIIEMYLRSKR